MLKEFRSIDVYWDKATRRIYEEVRASSSDEKGRKLTVQIVNDGQIQDLTNVALNLYWETQYGESRGLDPFEPLDAENGIYELYFRTGMLKHVGKLNAHLHLVDTTGAITSEPFTIFVFEGVDVDAMASDDELSALNQALVEVQTIKQDFVDESKQLIATEKAELDALQADYADRAETLETTYAPRLTSAEQDITTNHQEVTAQLAQKVEKNTIYFLNVKDYGVIGDGVTDDTQALQTLFTNLSLSREKVTVFFPGGTYLISDAVLVNLSNITLSGEKGATVIKSTTFHETLLWDNQEHYEQILIEKIRFEGVISNKGQGFVKFQGAKDVEVTQCQFVSCGGCGIINTQGVLENFNCHNNEFKYTEEAGLLLRPVKNIRIYNNYFTGIDGYNSSEPAHPIYIRADGLDIPPVLEDVYIYNNVIAHCNLHDFGGKSAIKVLSNSTHSPNYIGRNVRITNNDISDWTDGIQLAMVEDVVLSNNNLQLETEGITGYGIMLEKCGNVLIDKNNVDTQYDIGTISTLFSYNMIISSSQRITITGNTLNHNGYNCLRIQDVFNTNNVQDYIIQQNTIYSTSNKSDAYCFVVSNTVTRMDISNNNINTDVRGIHFGSSVVDTLSILRNTFKHINNQIGSTGIGISIINATVTELLQGGNLFAGFSSGNGNTEDIVIS